MAKYFDVTTDYLLGLTDAKKAENTKLSSDLGLNDEVIEAIELSYKPSKKRMRCLNSLITTSALILDDLDKYCLLKMCDEIEEKTLLKMFFKVHNDNIPDSDIDEFGDEIFMMTYPYWKNESVNWKHTRCAFQCFVDDIHESTGTIFTDDIDYLDYQLESKFSNMINYVDYKYNRDMQLKKRLENLYTDLYNADTPKNKKQHIIARIKNLIEEY